MALVFENRDYVDGIATRPSFAENQLNDNVNCLARIGLMPLLSAIVSAGVLSVSSQAAEVMPPRATLTICTGSAYLNLGSVPGSTWPVCITEIADNQFEVSGLSPWVETSVRQCEDADEHRFTTCIVAGDFLAIILPDNFAAGDEWYFDQLRFVALEEFCIWINGEDRCFRPVSVIAETGFQNMLFFEAGKGLTMFHYYLDISELGLMNQTVALVFTASNKGILADRF